jgi:hypothetical protein
MAAKSLAEALGRPVFVVIPPAVESHPGILVEADKFKPRPYYNGHNSIIARIAYPRNWRYKPALSLSKGRATASRPDGVIGGMVGAQP